MLPFTMSEENRAVREGWDILSALGYESFVQFVEQKKEEISPLEQGLLYLLRGGAKIHMCDPAIFDDIKRAEALLPERVEFFADRCLCLGPSPRFVRNLPRESGALTEYRMAVEKTGDVLSRITTNVEGSMMCAVIAAEIFCLQGKTDRAVAAAAPVYSCLEDDRASLLRFSAGSVLLRCLPMTGDAVWFKQILGSLTDAAKTRREYLPILRQIQGWVDAATGYLGRTARYITLPSGVELPDLDARTAWRKEQLLCDQLMDGERERCPLVPLSDIYTDLYYAMVFFRHCEPAEAIRRVAMAYGATHENRVYMPFAEYGSQIIPLLREAMKSKIISRVQVNKMTALAGQYEKGLQSIRSGFGGYEQKGPPAGLFTKAELHVLQLMCEGKSNAEISDAMENSLATVNELARRAFRKMRAQGREDAMEKAAVRKYFTTKGTKQDAP